MQKIIRWGILGTGWISARFAEDLKSVSNAKLQAVGSRTLASAQQFAEPRGIARAYGSYEEFVKDPDIDVVYVATPHIRHKEDCILCLEAGKAVLCEKPFALNSRDAQAIVNIAREKRLFCMEAMWMRFLPMAQQVQEMIRNGVIGDVRFLTADFGYPTEFDPESRFFNPALGGGALLDRGVYPLSLAFFLLGKPIYVSGYAHVGSTGVDEQSTMVLGYKEGMTATLSSTLRTYASNSATIVGTRGKILIHDPFCRPEEISITHFSEDPVVMTTHSSKSPGGLKEDFKLFLKGNKLFRKLKALKPSSTQKRLQIAKGNGYRYQAEEVVRCLTAGELESPIMPLDETVHILSVMDELRQSWNLKYPGEEVTVSSLVDESEKLIPSP